MDAAKAVAGGVVTHAARLRRIVRPGSERGRAAHLLGAGRHQVRHRADSRIDQDRSSLGELELALEKAERLAHAQRRGPEGEPTPAAVDAARLPTHELAAERDHASRLVVIDLTEVADLDPRRGYPTLAPDLKRLFVDLADRRRARVDPARHRYPPDGKPRPRPGDDEKKAETVRKRVCRTDACQVGEEQEQAERRGEGDLAHRESSVSWLPVECHLRHMLAFEQARDQLAGALPLHLRVRPQDDAVGEDGLGQRLDVVGNYVASSLDRGKRLARMEKVKRAAGARAQRDLRVVARAADEARDVLAKLRLDEHLADGRLGCLQLIG